MNHTPQAAIALPLPTMAALVDIARVPVAPMDCAVAKKLPAATLPIDDWIAAAVVPAATPEEAKITESVWQVTC